MAAPCRFNIIFKLLWQAVILASFVPQISTNPFKENHEYVLVNLDEFPVSTGNMIGVKALGNGQQKLCVFCYPGQDKKWYRLWTNPKLFLSSSDGKDFDYQEFYGNTESEVKEKSQSTSYIPWPSLPIVKDQFAFYPFNASCIGISSEHNYSLEFTVKNPHIVYVALTAVGLFLFFSAKAWSGNVALHYSVGVSVGVLGSLLIVIFIILKFVPEKLKTLTYVVGAVSTSVSLFLYQHVSGYLNHIVANNWKVLCIYVVLSSLISFAVVYRYGPVTNPRSLDLVRWVLQGFGLALVYHCSQIPEMSMAIILVALAAYNIPHRVLPTLNNFRFRYFPPQRRYLTEEEYRTEADVETKKALEDLRQFCHSPDCNTWKTVSRLTSPNKFAQFIEGDSHVSDHEYDVHVDQSEVNALEFTDEDSSEGEDDNIDNSIRPGSSYFERRNGSFKRS